MNIKTYHFCNPSGCSHTGSEKVDTFRTRKSALELQRDEHRRDTEAKKYCNSLCTEEKERASMRANFKVCQNAEDFGRIVEGEVAL